MISAQTPALFEQVISPQAAAGPERPAVISQGRICSYGLLDADIRRCIHRLSDEGIDPGARVLIDTPDLYMFWALAFACEALGLTACATPPTGTTESLVALLRPSLLVTTALEPTSPGLRTIQIDSAFVADLGAKSPAKLSSRDRRADDDIFVLCTSGTTGELKGVAITRAMLMARNAQFAAATPRADLPGARVLAPMGPWSLAGLLPAFNAWRLRGAVCAPRPGQSLAGAIAETEPAHVFLAPVHLQAWAAAVETPTSIADRHVFIIGGTPSSKLLEQSRARLSSDLWVCYGSTETGVVSGTHVDELGDRVDVAGRVFPWVEAEVLDAAGRALPPGKAGELRVRLDGMAAGYVGEASDAQDALFRDGWFHPGDVASLDADRVLRIHGRTDDLLHLGGAKILPAALESVIETRPGVQECAAFSAPDPDGLETPYVAVAADDGFEPGAVAEALFAVLGRPVKLIRVDVLPRNALGKVERTRLRAALIDRVRAAPA